MKDSLVLLLVVVLAVAACLYFIHPQLHVKVEPKLPSLPSLPRLPEPKPRLLLFTQPGCAPCDRLKESLKDPRVQEELKRFKFEEIDARSREARSCGVQATPTLVIMEPDHLKPFKKKVGYLTPDQLLAFLQSVK